jgi:CxxC-x17-CxxC domain-containing protein
MKKIIKLKSSAVEPQVQPDITASIEKIQQQLISLEKKIDTMISQSVERPSERKDHARPFRRFDNSYRQDRGGRENSFRERSFTKAICADCNTECEVPFKPTGDRPVYCRECFAKRNEGGSGSFKAKFDHSPRGRAPTQGRQFDKPQGRENSRPDGRKKPAFRKRRERS